MQSGSTRRGFLSAAGLAGLGAGLGLSAEAAGTADATATADAATATTAAEAVDFYGVHQAGIVTRTQEQLQFVALDIVSNDAGDLQALLQQLSAAAALACSGRPVGALETGTAPPVDTGESFGLAPARLTITFGLGPAIFARGRFGLHARKPAPLAELPAFANDSLDPGISGGDIAIQVCADDPQVAFHAAHDLIRLAAPTALPRWALAGFGPVANSRTTPTPRAVIGFKDGTDNIMLQEQQALEQYVWARAPESKPWMHGGSYMVARRIAVSLGPWDDTGLDQQQQTIGRYKLSGAPLTGVHEHDPVELDRKVGGVQVIPESAHIRQASPSYNHGQRLLRRGYTYLNGIDQSSGSAAGGQMFICYQRDPRKQFIPIQRRLANEDALSQFTTHVGSSIFACPPGARPGGYVGEGLFT